ncbi:MAG TPA: hypothetical protein VJN71_01935 [Nitrososphaerales archaeon]|nr:hypothetical protein [Nitrososphaerales archaeon]
MFQKRIDCPIPFALSKFCLINNAVGIRVRRDVCCGDLILDQITPKKLAMKEGGAIWKKRTKCHFESKLRIILG